MKPAQTERFACPHCAVQFSIQLEPDAAFVRVRIGNGRTDYEPQPDYQPQPVVCCPFCRGTIQEDQ